MANFVDSIPAELYDRYNQLLDMAAQAKANAPKPERKPRGPMTVEQKKKLAEGRLAKAQAALDALLAAEQA